MVRIGAWGTYDVEHLGDALLPRILRAEMERRLPSVEVVAFSPIGYVGLNRYEDDPPASPLGTWSDDRIDALAAALDLVVIGAGSIVHGDAARLAPWYGLGTDELTRRMTDRFFIEGLGKHEVDVPAAWLAIEVEPEPAPDLAARWRQALASRALVTVRDEPSRNILRAAGVDRPVDLIADPTFLLPRLFPTPTFEPRIERLRRSGAHPVDEALIVQGGATELSHVGEIAEAVDVIARARSLTPLIVESEPIHGDRAFADALEPLLPGAMRLPASAGVDDVMAAVAWSAGVVGRSRALHVLAAAYDRPAVLVNTEAAPRFADLAARIGTPERHVTSTSELEDAYDAVVARGSIAPLLDGVVASIDDVLDRLAALATEREVRLDAPPVLPGSTLADERERYAIATRAIGARLAATQAAFAERERDLRAYADAVNRELTEHDIRFTKLWRRVHEGDRHYHYHKHRADEAELRIEYLEREIQFLRGERVRPWLRRRVRLFMWWLRPTKLGRLLVRLRGRLRGRV